jgi:hypothetical protein
MTDKKKVTIEIDLDEFDALDYVGKADWLIAKVKATRSHFKFPT